MHRFAGLCSLPRLSEGRCMHSWATRLMALHCLNWLRVFRGINPVPFGPRVAQTCESRVGPQAKYAACRGRMSDGMYRIAAYLRVHSKSVHRRFVHSTSQTRCYYTVTRATQCANVVWLDLVLYEPQKCAFARDFSRGYAGRQNSQPVICLAVKASSGKKDAYGRGVVVKSVTKRRLQQGRNPM